MSKSVSHADLVLSQQERRSVKRLLETLQGFYTRAESLMLKPQGASALKLLLLEINECYNKIMSLCEEVAEEDSMPDTNSKKEDVVTSKGEFDARVSQWLEKVEQRGVHDAVSVRSIRSRRTHSSVSTSSSRRRVKALNTRSVALQLDAERAAEQAEKEKRQLEDERLALEREAEEKQLALKREEEAKQREAEEKRLALKREAEEKRLAVEREAEEKRLALERRQREAEQDRIMRENDIKREMILIEHEREEELSCMSEMSSIRGERIPKARLPKIESQPVLEGKQTEKVMPTHDRQPLPFFTEPLRQLKRSPPVLRKVTEHNFKSEIGERFLPKPQIAQFNGDPLEYRTFMIKFDSFIGARLAGDKTLALVYLIQHCEKHVADLLIPYSDDTINGYDLARQCLEFEFGSAHRIARACERSLHEISSIIDDKPESLRRLSVKIQKCLSALQEVQSASVLDTVDFISSIVRKLPPNLQEDWIKYSAEVEAKAGYYARFNDFAEFIFHCSKTLNSTYGRSLRSGSGKRQKNIFQRRGVGVHSTEVSVATPEESNKSACNVSKFKPICVVCKKAHYLGQCYEFRGKSLQERRDLVKNSRLCFCCLNPGHFSRNCVRKKLCSVKGCKSDGHHWTLHPDEKKSLIMQEGAAEASVNSVAMGDTACCLNVVPVVVFSNGREFKTYALLDPGSSASFCIPELVQNLKLKGKTCNLWLKTVNGDKLEKTQTFSFKVRSMDRAFDAVMSLQDVVMVPSIPASPNPLPEDFNSQRYDYLKNFSFPFIDQGRVTLLLGANLAEVHEWKVVASGSSCNDPTVMRSKLGLSLVGGQRSLSTAAMNNVVVTKSLESELSQPFGSSVVCEIGRDQSAEDRQVFQMLKDTVRMVDGHYCLPLPWKSSKVELPDNMSSAHNRLRSLQRRFAKDGELRVKYHKKMQSYIDSNYAEEIKLRDCVSSGRVWYLPHHPVVKPNKIRIVFDCASVCSGVSLNDMLFSGPDLVNSLVGVLLRFRKNRIAIASDIKEMFHQVRVAADDRDAFRFLWWPGGDMSKDPVPHRMLVHLFGSRSSPSIAAFCLRQVAVEFGHLFPPETSIVVRKNFYVDDCLLSVQTEEEGIAIAANLKELLLKAGFVLTKWLCNSQAVMDSLPAESHAKCLTELSLGDDVEEKVLGVHWSVSGDRFEFKVRPKENSYTRRGILSTINSLFDPLGFVAPVVLEARKLQRNFIEQGLGWDEAIDNEDVVLWENWLEQLHVLREVRIRRCLEPAINVEQEINKREIHIFSDASLEGYGAVAYLRTENCIGEIDCVFLMGKALLSKKGAMTIPRMELTAALLAARMSSLLRDELQLTCNVIFWCDSEAVLHCIRNRKRRFKIFFAHRLEEIGRTTSVESWRHVPGNLNPADQASRGLGAKAFVKSGLWVKGPQFLKFSEDLWPCKMKSRAVEVHAEVANEVVSNHAEISDLKGGATQRLICHFSDLNRLKVAASWILRFGSFLAQKAIGEDKPEPRIQVSELKAVERSLVKYEQVKYFCGIISSLMKKQGSGRVNVPKWLKRLNPFVEGGVLRVGGRLDEAPISYDQRHPAILPCDSHVTRLFVKEAHQRCGHSGFHHTGTLLREKYWLEKASIVIRKIIGQCVGCRRRYGKSGEQFMADLPYARLRVGESPFSHVGVDYFGPLLVKQGRSEVKRWGAIFTCMTTRAVHLEVAFGLSSDEFLLVFRRFTMMRGCVTHIYSDNGTNFIGAEKIMKDAIRGWNQSLIVDEFRQKGIVWKFNPPGASHFGGSWERQIRSVRRILLSLAMGRTHSDSTLMTLFVEVAAMINSRPLTPLSFAPGSQKPLTPSDLLLLRPPSVLPPVVTTDRDCYAAARWRQIQRLSDHFWNRFVKEYLPSIAIRPKWREQRRNFAVGDIVAIVDDGLPRGQWKMGRILEVFSDKVGFVRSVFVRIGHSHVRRPITKLCLLVEADGGPSNEGNPEIRPGASREGNQEMRMGASHEGNPEIKPKTGVELKTQKQAEKLPLDEGVNGSCE